MRLKRCGGGSPQISTGLPHEQDSRKMLLARIRYATQNSQDFRALANNPGLPGIPSYTRAVGVNARCQNEVMCLLILGIAFPRFVLLLLFFFTDFLSSAYHGLLLPVLGFFFLPLTTLIYAWIVNSGARPEGVYLVALVICALVDLGLIGGTAHRSRR